MGSVEKWLPKAKQKLVDGFSADYTQWPWVSSKKGIPDSRGIYIISIVYGTSRKRKLMYVGMSTNLKQRLQSHPAMLFLKAIGFETKVHFIECYEYEKNERFLIEATQPPLNYRGCVVGFSLEKMIKDDLFGL